MSDKQRVLLVGLNVVDWTHPDASVDVRGLGAAKVIGTAAAEPLYNYDLIVVDPRSFSHFIFGLPGAHSEREDELRALKNQNPSWDLDDVFYGAGRARELSGALKVGARVVLIATVEKEEHFYGRRSNFLGYMDTEVISRLHDARPTAKKSKKVIVTDRAHVLAPYFDNLKHDGWELAWNPGEGDRERALAEAPDGSLLASVFSVEEGSVWVVTPPTTPEAAKTLVECALRLPKTQTRKTAYHGLFLAHSSEDKAFVRELRTALKSRGVEKVWLDEVEIKLGDSLMIKIQGGISESEYFGVVLSPRSVSSPWVQRELEAAMTLELHAQSVKVLPLLYEKCDLPPFIESKLYADFTSTDRYEASIDKILRRLERSS